MTTNADFMAQLKQRFLAEPAYHFVGLNPLRIEAGLCISDVKVRPHHLHHRGAMQGGLVAMLADATAGYAALASLPEQDASDDMATIEFKTSFLRPAVAKRLICVADVIRSGHRTCFAQAKIYCDLEQPDALCATATLTFKRLVAR